MIDVSRVTRVASVPKRNQKMKDYSVQSVSDKLVGTVQAASVNCAAEEFALAMALFQKPKNNMGVWHGPMFVTTESGKVYHRHATARVVYDSVKEDVAVVYFTETCPLCADLLRRKQRRMEDAIRLQSIDAMGKLAAHRKGEIR